MARQKSEFLSALGILFEILRLLVNDILAAGGSDEDIRRIGTDSTLRKKLVDVILQAKEFLHQTAKVMVDYSRSIADGISAGIYDRVSKDITEKNFPTTQSGKAETEIRLVYFGKFMSTDTVLAEMEKQNLRPATIQELLAIGENYPELQRESPIVALGSVWVRPYGGRYVPYLGGSGGGRRLDLDWDEGDWHGRCRFAAVSK